MLESWPKDTLLQSIANENQLSETVFLVSSGTKYELRWFTPKVEVDLCGHATLAASFVLYRQLKAGPGPLIFHSQSGELQVHRNDDIFFWIFPVAPQKKFPVQTCWSGLWEHNQLPPMQHGT